MTLLVVGRGAKQNILKSSNFRESNPCPGPCTIYTAIAIRRGLQLAFLRDHRRLYTNARSSNELQGLTRIFYESSAS